MLKNKLLPWRLFQTEFVAAEKALPPMMARPVREMTDTVEDEKLSGRRVQTSQTRCSCLDRYTGVFNHVGSDISEYRQPGCHSFSDPQPVKTL